MRRACGADRTLRRAVESLLDRDSKTPPPTIPEPEGAAGPRRVGRYRLLEPLGQGGMNQVFAAERVDGVGGAIALKLFAGPIEERTARLFERECEILARLEHPGIARFLDGGTTDNGTRFLAMERVEGVPLLDHCDARRLGVRARLEIFLEIAAAVDHAHVNLVAHRDLKPQNVLVTDEGRTKLLDFGIAKFLGTTDLETTRPADRFLTPAYASPEQVSGGSVGTTSDIYSLGTILYELLTGRPPFDPEVLMRDGALAVRRHGARPPSVTVAADHPAATNRGVNASRLQRRLRGDLDAIAARCLEFDPRRRYPSVERLANDVRRHLDGLPIHARPAGLGVRIGKSWRRNPVAVATSALAVAAVAASIGALIWRHQSVVHERDRAREAHRQADEVTRVLTDVLRFPDPYRIRTAGDSRDEPTTRQLVDFARTEVEHTLTDQPLLQARLMSSLGQVFVNLGRIDEGVALLRQAQTRRERLLEPTHAEVEAGLRQIGTALLDAGRASEAAPLLQRSLALARRSPDDPRQLADSLSASSQLLMHEGDFEGAAARLTEALALRRSFEDPSTHRHGRDLLALGWAQWMAKRHPVAEQTLRRAHTRLRAAVGDSHPDIATSLHRLGWVAVRLGDHTEAERKFRASLALRERLYGSDHPETLAGLAALGEHFHARGEPDQAEPILRRVLDLERTLKGERHPDVAIDLHTLGQVLWDRGDLAGAIPLFHQATELARECWGPDYRASLMYSRSLGLALVSTGNTEDAEPLLRDTLNRSEARFGAEHRYFGFALAGWAELLLAQGRVDEALAAAERSVTIVRAALPDDSWRIAEVETSLGGALAATGRVREAAQVLRPSLERLERARRPRLRRLAASRLDRLPLVDSARP